MIRFFDASALAKRYVDEPQSEEARRFFAAGIPAASRLSEVELTSALVRRWRAGELSQAERDRALGMVREDFTALTVVELVPEVAALACRLLPRHALRAGDAVQLASCLYLERKLGRAVEFVGFDERLGEAAAQEGLAAPAAGSPPAPDSP